MGLYFNRPKRLVIPRWRDFKDTAKSGELNKQKVKESPVIPDLSIDNQIDNWNKQKSVINAIELVNSAFVINKKENALEAAKFIIENCDDQNHPSFRISKLILNSPNENVNIISSPAESFEALNLKIQRKIQEKRKRLSVYPNNSLLWIDLARWYTVIGNIYKAEKCIKTAIQLSPQNIFIIRSAVRFFIHKARYDKEKEDSLAYALQLIRKNPATKIDPWLMATEISLCQYLDKTSNLMKAGFSLIEAKKFSPFSLSELTAALATVELRYDANKSKRLFKTSLIDPNENTVAQAQWATNIVGDLPNLTNFNSYEASSFENLYLENWNQSFDEALNWLVDQPFSLEPAGHASHLASSVIDNNQLAIQICEFGLRSNPHAFILLNNKAYCHAVERNIFEAERTFNQININSLSTEEKIIYTATKGLIHCMKGNTDYGISLYNEAEDLARKIKDDAKVFEIKLYRTRTEFICGCNTMDGDTAIASLVKEMKNFKYPIYKRIMENLAKRLDVVFEPQKVSPSKNVVLQLK